jgi:hypothetical protein
MGKPRCSRALLFTAVTLLSAALTRSFVSDPDLAGLKLHNVRAESVLYRGRKAIHVTQVPGAVGEDTFATVTASEFQDGSIDVDLAGSPKPGAGEASRGFIGIAFRIRPDISKFEFIYLRPTNGRAEDQLRRNHSTQYASFPDWPWQRTRQETPGRYESYVDLEPGAWTQVRVTVSGPKARLYVHGAEQPSLIVDDLKLPPAKGAIAVWVGPGTDGYFSNLRVTAQ